jgi:hypothetical protein
MLGSGYVQCISRLTKSTCSQFHFFVGKTPVPVVATEDEDEELARAVAASLEESKGSDTSEEKIEPEVENEPSLSAKLNYPPLPEEPKGSRELLCRVAIRLPDGRRIQRNFLHTDPIKVRTLK